MFRVETQQPTSLELKRAKLEQILRDMGSVLIAFSGGVDSALVYKVASDVLGDQALGVTGYSASVPESDLAEVRDFVQRFRLNHQFVPTEELDNANYRSNPANRCYFCKEELYSQLNRIRQERGIAWIIDGTNADDANDHRPGIQAARLQGVRSPLQEAGLTKHDIRLLSKQLDLPTWNKPATACLASRFPYGVSISEVNLRRVDRCENFLRSLGIGQLRVRHHEDLARIEVLPEDFPIVLRHQKEIIEFFKGEGYIYITLDLQGFRSGSLNETLKAGPCKEGSSRENSQPSKKRKSVPRFVPKTFGPDTYTLYIDGACAGNPGPAAWGYILFDGQGAEVHRQAGTLPEATNNIAEYQALIHGLRYAREHQLEKVHVLTDSQLVERQIQGVYRVKNRQLQQLALEVQKLRMGFEDFKTTFIPRRENTLADRWVEQHLKSRAKRRPAKSEQSGQPNQ